MLIIQYVGSLGLSAFAAYDSILWIFWAVPTGIQAVSRMLISISVGEEDRKSLVDSMKTALFKGIPFTGVFSVAIIIAAQPLTRLFYRDPLNPVYPMTVMALRILPISLMLCIISMLFKCYGQISGKQVLVHVLSALDGVVCVAVFTALLMPSMKMNAVYLANVINGLVCAVVVFLYSWIVRKKMPKNMEELMLIPEEFGVEADARIDISVHSMSEVLSVSQQVINFSRSRGIDERRSYFAGLFLEEMAGNVVNHGFRKDKKRHSVDIRVVHKNEDMILRIKDDCIPFNPKEWQEVMDPKDRMKGVGIRLVYQGAKDIQYQNMLGLNVLTIRI
jgi:anti-sigma regulatory factor (Ser/Thr protein kinase)